MRMPLAIIIALSLTGQASAADQNRAVFEVAKRAVDGFDTKDWSFVESATWPDGYLIQKQQHGSALKRHWNSVPFSAPGILVERSLGRPKTVIRGDRARVVVSYVFRLNFADRLAEGIDAPVECSVGTYQFDLRRRNGEWRVLTLTDSVRRPSRTCAA